MKPHVHVGIVTGLATFASVILVGTLWRTAAYRMIERAEADNRKSPMGEAMAYMY